MPPEVRLKLVRAYAMPELLTGIYVHLVIAPAQMRPHRMDRDVQSVGDVMSRKAIVQGNGNFRLAAGEIESLAKIDELCIMIGRSLLQGYEHAPVFRRSGPEYPVPATAMAGMQQGFHTLRVYHEQLVKAGAMPAINRSNEPMLQPQAIPIIDNPPGKVAACDQPAISLENQSALAVELGPAVQRPLNPLLGMFAEVEQQFLPVIHIRGML